MTKSLEELVQREFAAGGSLSKVTSGYSQRASQVEFAKAVANAFDNGESLIVEAGTGTGKTFAYLVPALICGGKILISTAGKTLQEQLFQKDVPAVMKALGIGSKVALLKGRNNYICVNRFEYAWEANVAKSKEEVAHLHEVKRFIKVTKTGDRSDISTVPDNSGIWKWVTSTSENCLSMNCPSRDKCFVLKAREKAKEADILIVNHHLFLADMALKDRDFADFLPSFDLVIFDEAHQLPAIATDFFSAVFSLSEVRTLAEELMILGARKIPKAVNWKPLSVKVKNRCTELRNKFKDLGLSDDQKEIFTEIPSISELVESLEKIEASIQDLIKPFVPLTDTDEEIKQAVSIAENLIFTISYWEDVCKNGGCLANDNKEKVRWFHLTAKSAFFYETPLNNAVSFKTYREKQNKPWILTSATLSVNKKGVKDFSHFVEEMGLEGVTAKSWDSPFDFPSQAMLYIPEDIVDPSNPMFPEAVAEKAWPLIKEYGGKAFVLCTSLRAMERIAADLRMRIENESVHITVLVQNEFPKQELIRRFREDNSSVLVGSMGFWEGVDIKGEALSLVVIDKIPFAKPDDPIFRGKSELLRSKNRNPFFDYSVPEAVVELKQGAGRLIRDSTDTGVLAICDSRILNKSYGSSIWRSLPNFSRSRTEGPVLEFIRSHRNAGKKH